MATKKRHVQPPAITNTPPHVLGCCHTHDPSNFFFFFVSTRAPSRAGGQRTAPEREQPGRTYSFGNSPSANEHRSDVLPHAPTWTPASRPTHSHRPPPAHTHTHRIREPERTRRRKKETLAIADNDEFSPNLGKARRQSSVPKYTSRPEAKKSAQATTYRVLR